MKKITLLFTLFCFASRLCHNQLPHRAKQLQMSSLCSVMLTRSIATTKSSLGTTNSNVLKSNRRKQTLEYANLNYQGLDYPQQMSQPWNICIWTTQQRRTALEFLSNQ